MVEVRSLHGSRLALARAQTDPVAWAQRERENSSDTDWDSVIAVLAAEASKRAQVLQLEHAVRAAEAALQAHGDTTDALADLLHGEMAEEHTYILTGPTKRLIGQAKTRIALLEQK